MPSFKCFLYLLTLRFQYSIAFEPEACIKAEEYLHQAVRREPSEALASKSSASNRFFNQYAPGSLQFLHPIPNCDRFVAMEHFPEESRAFRLARNSSEQFAKSLSLNLPLQPMEIRSKGFSSFFRTADKSFFLKTMHSGELKLWTKKGLAQQYYRHFHTTPSSLLTQFMGVYSVYDRRYKWFTHFIIMKNVLQDCMSDTDYEEFDLKGSTWNRFREPPHNPQLDENFGNRKIAVPSDEFGRQLRDQLEKDTSLLESFSTMDYSLLMGIQSLPKTSPQPNSLGTYRIPPDTQVCLGIIDFLTEYNLLLKATHYGKRVVYGRKSNGQSNKRPWKYRKRFIDYIQDKIEKVSMHSSEYFL